MKTYRGREIETEQLDDGKWIACAQDAIGVMVVADPDGTTRQRRMLLQMLKR